MKTQQLILILFFGLALFTGCQNEETKHNILFISIDDLKPSINSYGDSKMITPNIENLLLRAYNLIMLLPILQFVERVVLV